MSEEANRRVPNLLHLLLFLALTIVIFFVAEFATVALSRQPMQHAAFDQKLQLIVTAAVYLMTLAAAWVLFPALWDRSFLAGIGWNARGAKPLLAVLGLVAGFAAEAISNYLPAPREMPLDEVFRTPGIIWLLVVFGTVLAPLFEEIVFRGFLLPALANGVDWLRLPHAKTEESDRLHEQWRESEYLSPLALGVASLLTSALFALIHAPQLGFNWAPVGLLMGVSLVLCWVRIRTGSVAASTLFHGFYNLAAFVLIFVSTGGFRHMG